MAVGQLCGGDGMADVVGSRWGRTRLGWNRDKSWAGSAAFVTFGAIFSLILIWVVGIPSGAARLEGQSVRIFQNGALTDEVRCSAAASSQAPPIHSCAHSSHSRAVWLISVICAATESLPLNRLGLDDNLLVPIVAYAAAHALL